MCKACAHQPAGRDERRSRIHDLPGRGRLAYGRQMLMRFLVSLCLLGLLVGVAACPDPKDKPRVSDDPREQAKFELVRRAVADIKLARARKRDFYGDCRAVQMLLAKKERKSAKAPLRKLVAEIDELCKGTHPY